MIKCDAIKIAYRQSKDGFVVSFAIHPQEMSIDLANADIGSQWQLTLVPLDEHGNAPVNRLVQQAGICCKDPMFWHFLTEHGHPTKGMLDARGHVHLICNVGSRADLISGTAQGNKWDDLYSQFVAWRDAPERAA